MNSRQLANLANTIQRLERQGVKYVVNKNGSVKIIYDTPPQGRTPNRLTTGLRCMTAHAKGRICWNARGSIAKK